MRRASELAAVLGLLLLGGCVATAFAPAEREALRVSALVHEGDPTRRASLRLVISGLDADAAGDSDLAWSRYQRAIQIDPTNPFAYLAIARRELESGEAVRALEVLDRAEQLLDAEERELFSPGVEPHLLGLRGAALAASGRAAEGEPLLRRARALAPDVWGDARLTAAELR